MGRCTQKMYTENVIQNTTHYTKVNTATEKLAASCNLGYTEQ